MGNKITITTTPFPDGRIEQEVHGLDFSGLILRSVMDTKEQQIRDALIDLGWTPPKENQ